MAEIRSITTCSLFSSTGTLTSSVRSISFWRGLSAPDTRTPKISNGRRSPYRLPRQMPHKVLDARLAGPSGIKGTRHLWMDVDDVALWLQLTQPQFLVYQCFRKLLFELQHLTAMPVD
jgi:hypothetical protein